MGTGYPIICVDEYTIRIARTLPCSAYNIAHHINHSLYGNAIIVTISNYDIHWSNIEYMLRAVSPRVVTHANHIYYTIFERAHPSTQCREERTHCKLSVGGVSAHTHTRMRYATYRRYRSGIW